MVTVKFWPRYMGIPASVCAHRFDAVCTVSQQTDSRFLTSVYAVEIFGFKNNFRVGDFISNAPVLQYNDGVYDAEVTGLIRNDIYYYTDKWLNPTTGVIEEIPDYYATAWTAKGVAAFNAYYGLTNGGVKVALGGAKAARTPNHGQEMYYFSAPPVNSGDPLGPRLQGQLGYDFVNELMGLNNLNEVSGVVDYHRNWFYQTLNRVPSGISYRNGQAAMAGTLYPYFLGGRNSSNGPISTNGSAQTWYGSTYGFKTGTLDIREYFNSYVNSSRWWDFWSNMGYSRAQADAYVTQEIIKTIANRGWYRDFIHWHSARDAGTLTTIDEFYAMMRSTFGANFVWTCSNGEALEYMFLRESVQRVAAVEIEGNVLVIADVIAPFATKSVKGIPAPDLFNTYNIPLSVRVDLTSTSLAGKQVKSNYGKIRSLGSNVYIVQIPFQTKSENIIGVTLSEGTDGIFVETKPVITTSISDGILTVQTNMPTKAVLFGVATGGQEIDSLPIARSNAFNTIHAFEHKTGMSYRVGAISEFYQASLKVL